MAYFSIIIPVYNRPQEVKELLESLSQQTNKDFEVVIVEDGSTLRCEEVVHEYTGLLNIKYYYKSNSGRSQSRNYGMERATGEYLVFFDSDCIIPEEYFGRVKKYLETAWEDCYGGPDAAHASFSNLQKAVNYSMTSFFTTGGIRGGRKGLEKFVPRTFNMGFSMEVYRKVGGFKDMFGEDIDLSTRIADAGFSTALYQDAYVYHKRRVSLKSFYKQVYVFGMARIDLYQLHSQSLKLVHCFPAAFVIGSILLLLLCFLSFWMLLPLGVYVMAVFIGAFCKNGSLSIALLAVCAAFVQLFGYGNGFLSAFWKKVILRREVDKEEELEKHYKKK
ncbi:glycosyltransferase [Odoribacter lunatus]|uniref:glycosyltransferase n=1 Tax=Odoribacter lunatus TaxID=2941335 RepID=UPI00203FA094|nr:glycosyltransferase [Odoribacter lunatus]